MSPGLAETDPEDPGEEKQEPVVKQRQPQKAPMSPGLAETDPEDSGDSDTEDTLRDMGFPIGKSLEANKIEEEPVLKKGIYTEVKKYHMLQNLIATTLKKC